MFEKAYDKLKAIDLIKNNVRNSEYREYVYLMYINIYNGNKLLDDFEETEHLPTFFRQMIYIGEESSSLGPLLRKSAEYYQERLDRYTASLKSIIEPGLIIVILIIILPIILAVIIPMFDIMGQL
jgi:type IV pilus assembly protein PilC